MHVLLRLRQRYNITISKEELFELEKRITFGEPILPFKSLGNRGKISHKKSALVNIKGHVVPCGIAIPNGYVFLNTALPRMGENTHEAFEEVARHGSIKAARRARPDWQLMRELAWVQKTVAKIVTAVATNDPLDALPILLENLRTNFEAHLSKVDPGAEPLIHAIGPAALRSDLNALRFVQGQIEDHISRTVAAHPLSWDLVSLPNRWSGQPEETQEMASRRRA